MNDKIKIGIMAQCGGIVPAIYGGAVETLLTMIIDENERQHLCDITIFVSSDEQAEGMARKYRYTDFVFIKQRLYKCILYKLKRQMYVNLMPGTTSLTDDFSEQIVKYIVNGAEMPDRDFDAFIVEEGLHINGLKPLVDIFKDKIFYHSHLHEVPVNGSIWQNVIAVSDFCRREWLSVASNTTRADVLYNGIDLERFSVRLAEDERKRLRKSLNIHEEEIVLIYVGRIIPVKGVRELLSAVELLHDQNIRLLLCGSSSFAKGGMTAYMKEVKRMADKLSGRVVYTGYIANEELYKYYQIADIQAVPSMWEEPAGLVAIEGMASGLPLVVTNSGGMVEYVDNESALIVDKNENVAENLAKAISRLAYDEELRKNMGLHGKQRAKAFSKESYYRNFVNVIANNVLSGGANHRFIFCEWIDECPAGVAA